MAFAENKSAMLTFAVVATWKWLAVRFQLPGLMRAGALQQNLKVVMANQLILTNQSVFALANSLAVKTHLNGTGLFIFPLS